MRLAAAVLTVLALSGCSLFGERAEELRFATLVQNDTFLPVVGDPSADDAPGVLVVLQSEQDEQFFRGSESAPPFPRAIDYRREAVMGYAVPSAAVGGRVTITRITPRATRCGSWLWATVSCPRRTADGAVAAQFVVVPAVGDQIAQLLASYRLDQQP